MNGKIMAVGLGLVLASGGFAAGINWTYDGSVRYDKAIVVWADGFTNIKSAFVDAGIRWAQVQEELARPNNKLTVADILSQCARDNAGDKIYAFEVDLSEVPVRLKNDTLYIGDVTGWGFSLFVNLDAEGFITEYAINELTTGLINSAPDLRPTELTIVDTNLTAAVSAYGSSKLDQAGAPEIVAHEREAQRSRALPSDEANTFTFDIINAVNGFIYQIVESTDLNGEFVRNPALDRRAESDGRLDFTVPIDPTEKVKFYKVRVGGNLLK